MSARSGKRCNVLVQCRDLWEGVKGGERWSKTWAMRAHAAAQRLELSLGAYADSLYSLTQVFPLHLYPGSILGCLGSDEVHVLAGLFEQGGPSLRGSQEFL